MIEFNSLTSYVANNCITNPVMNVTIAIPIMLALKKRSSRYWLLANHFAILLCPCRLNQFPRPIMHWFPSVLNWHNITSILTMPGMTVQIVIIMPACCSVSEYLKTTMQIVNTKGVIYNNARVKIHISTLTLGLLSWIIPCYKPTTFEKTDPLK